MIADETVSPTFVYGGFWRRFVARVIDVLLLLIPTIVLSMIIPVAAGVILGLLYWPVFDASRIQGTPGKFFMGLVVTDEQGGRIDFKRSITRYLLSWVSGLMLCVGYLFNLFTPRRQTFHDMFAGTLVLVREQKEDVDWWSVWSTEFKTVVEGLRRKFDSGDATVSTSSVGSPSGVGSQAMRDLEQLHELFRKGALTEAEFEAKKAEILKRF